MAMDKLLESKHKITKINLNKKEEIETNIGLPSLPSFDEKYRRVTTYIQKDVYRRIMSLKAEGRIGKMTDFVNKAISEYLYNHLRD